MDGTPTDIVDPIDDSTGNIDSPISFKVHYNEEQNRFSISRTDPGRFYKSGQFDIAIEHYQLAKAFGCPWGSKFNTSSVDWDSDGNATYYKDAAGNNLRFYIPKTSDEYTGDINDDSGTWTGNSLGKTFEFRHSYYLLSSERWSS